MEYKYNGAHLDESKECGVIPGLIGTCRWEYTYDGRGNLISEDKYTRTTTGMEWQNVMMRPTGLSKAGTRTGK